jgi:AbrB family looped-hinge helix DNA binding protein
MHDKKLFGTATVGSKGQVVIPANAREEMQINTGDKLYVFGTKHFVGFLKAEEFSAMLEHVTEQADALRSFKEKADKE